MTGWQHPSNCSTSVSIYGVDYTVTNRDKLRGENELILYLDYDGVLHHENCYWHARRGAYLVAPQGHTLFQHAALLESLLDPYPEVQIVLSTSWVRRLGYSRTAKRLPLNLRQRVIGATYHSLMDRDAFEETPRGMQIWADVVRRKPRAWLALDDDWVGWPAFCQSNYVQTNEITGLSDPIVLDVFSQKLRQLRSG